MQVCSSPHPTWYNLHISVFPQAKARTWIHRSPASSCNILYWDSSDIIQSAKKKPFILKDGVDYTYHLCYPTIRLHKLFLKNPTSRKQLYSKTDYKQTPDASMHKLQRKKTLLTTVPCLPQGKSLPEPSFTQIAQQPLSASFICIWISAQPEDLDAHASFTKSWDSHQKRLQDSNKYKSAMDIYILHCK